MGSGAISPFDPPPFLSQAGPGRVVSEYRKGQVVFMQGDPADAVFYIQVGKINVTVLSACGKQAVVAILSAGDFLGEGCLAGQLQRTTTAGALTDSVISRIEKAIFSRALHDEPAFSFLFMSRLLARNMRLEEDLIDQLLNSSEKRLARLLLLMTNCSVKTGPELVIDKFSQEMLAAMIGTTRSRVSFFMNKFRRLGLINYNGDSSDGLHIFPTLLNKVLHG